MIKRRRTDSSAETPPNESAGADGAAAPEHAEDPPRESAPLAEADPAAVAAPSDDAGEAGSTGRPSEASENATDSSAGSSSRRRGRKRKREKGAAGASAGQANATGGSGAGDNGGSGDSGGSDGQAPPPRKGGRVIASLALLLALAAGGAAGYLGWRVIELEERVAGIPEQRETELEPLASEEALGTVQRELEQRTDSLERRLEDQVNSLEQQLTRAEDERGEAIARLEQRVETAETAVQSMREQRERDGADWRMAEVRYLVSLAVRQLQITGNVGGAVAALEAADHALGQMGDPRVLDLRERIVEDIDALRAVEPADVEGIALRVQNVAPRIPDLVRATPESDGDNAKAQEDAQASASGEDGGWWAALNRRLGELVTVRREPEANPPTPEPAQAETPAPSAELPPAERLLLALREASRAALNHEPQSYRAAIKRARTIVAEEYDPAAPVNQRFGEDLAALHERRVTTELPDLTPTLERTQALAARLQGGAGETEGNR